MLTLFQFIDVFNTITQGYASLLMSILFSVRGLRPVRLGRPYQEHKVPAGIARKFIEAGKHPPPPQRQRGVIQSAFIIFRFLPLKTNKNSAS